MASILADTNILLRFSNRQAPHHDLVITALEKLHAEGFRLLFTPQNMRELWNVATRPPSANGFGYSISDVELLANHVEKVFVLLNDQDSMHQKWRRLVLIHEVKGIQVHDARLAAAALVSNCRAILTLNDTDFKRFGVSTLHPKDVDAFLVSA